MNLKQLSDQEWDQLEYHIDKIHGSWGNNSRGAFRTYKSLFLCGNQESLLGGLLFDELSSSFKIPFKKIPLCLKETDLVKLGVFNFRLEIGK